MVWPNTNVLGTGEGAAGGAELPFPNRLGAGVEVVEDVEFVVGLFAINEKAGLGAAAESAAPCPKVNTGFGGSVVDGSFLSAGFPKVKVG